MSLGHLLLRPRQAGSEAGDEGVTARIGKVAWLIH